MIKIIRIGDLYVFHCPGCRNSHGFDKRWTFNDDFEKPTFAPSLLCEPDSPENRCHSFVRNGMIEFLSDCHHDLAGQTVPVPDWDEEYL